MTIQTMIDARVAEWHSEDFITESIYGDLCNWRRGIGAEWRETMLSAWHEHGLHKTRLSGFLTRAAKAGVSPRAAIAQFEALAATRADWKPWAHQFRDGGLYTQLIEAPDDAAARRRGRIQMFGDPDRQPKEEFVYLMSDRAAEFKAREEWLPVATAKMYGGTGNGHGLLIGGWNRMVWGDEPRDAGKK